MVDMDIDADGALTPRSRPARTMAMTTTTTMVSSARRVVSVMVMVAIRRHHHRRRGTPGGASAARPFPRDFGRAADVFDLFVGHLAVGFHGEALVDGLFHLGVRFVELVEVPLQVVVLVAQGDFVAGRAAVGEDGMGVVGVVVRAVGVPVVGPRHRRCCWWCWCYRGRERSWGWWIGRWWKGVLS
jgi:hypothetical protein